MENSTYDLNLTHYSNLLTASRREKRYYSIMKLKKRLLFFIHHQQKGLNKSCIVVMKFLGWIPYSYFLCSKKKSHFNLKMHLQHNIFCILNWVQVSFYGSCRKLKERKLSFCLKSYKLKADLILKNYQLILQKEIIFLLLMDLINILLNEDDFVKILFPILLAKDKNRTQTRTIEEETPTVK